MSDDQSVPNSSSLKTLFFVVVICFICAFLLSLLASSLKNAQTRAKELDRSKQLLIAAKILSYEGSFLIKMGKKDYQTAVFDQEKQILVPAPFQKASQNDILSLYSNRVMPRLVDDEGRLFTFEEAGINEDEYIEKNQKQGYAHLPLKLIYLVLPNLSLEELKKNDPLAQIYVIPINGFGLWDAIYGYLALSNDADTVIGTTWYQQSETAGLGANISLPSWQKQFLGKLVFQKSPDGKTNYERTPLGLTVIKSKVKEILGSSPKAASSIDGITGASITGQGVTSAYHDSLAPYRPFLIQARDRYLKEGR